MTKRNRKGEAKSSVNLDGETINIEPVVDTPVMAKGGTYAITQNGKLLAGDIPYDQQPPEEIVIDITEPSVIKGPPMATPEYILVSPEHLTYRRKDSESLTEYANRMSDFGVLRICCNCKRTRPYRQQSCPRCGINLHLFIKERAPGETGDVFHEDMLQYNDVKVSNTL